MMFHTLKSTIEQLSRTKNLYYLINFFGFLQFLLPVWVFFARDYLGLSYTQVFLLPTIQFVTMLIFEIPTGSWADRFGRKRLSLAAQFLFLLANCSLLITNNFSYLVLAFTVRGFAYALDSGTLESLVYDNFKTNESYLKRYKQITSNKQTFLFLGRASAALLAGYLFIYNPLAPVVAYIIAIIISIFLTTLLPELEYESSSKSNDLEQIRAGLIKLGSSGEMLAFVGVLTLFTFLANIYFFSYQPILESAGFAPETISLIYVLVSIFSALGSQLYKRSGNDSSFVTIKFMYFGLILSGVLFLVFDSGIPSLLAPLLLSVIFGVQVPLKNSFLNERIGSEVRSTTLSSVSFLSTIAIALATLLTGYLLDQIAIPTLIAAVIVPSVIVLVISTSILFSAKKHNSNTARQ
ncbi:MAG: MFS transporter [Candidatus Dojkabacteria bacterium]